MKPRFSDYLQTGNGSPGLINRGNKDNRSKAILLTCLKKKKAKHSDSKEEAQRMCLTLSMSIEWKA